MTSTTIRAALGALATLTVLSACGSSAAAPSTPPGSGAPQTAEAHDLDRRDVDAWLDGLLPAALEREGIPGAGVAVVHDGEILTSRGYGLADVEQQEPVDPADTLFRVGSVSKVFTATAVMQLVERGEVDLDEPVTSYVDLDLPTRFDTPVTLRHLLTHTAGFEERVRGLIGPPGAEVDLREVLADDPPEQVYEPGTVPAYSNYGNALAGLVVEEVSGQRFEDYVAEHVLEPADMASSTFEQPLPAPLTDRLAQGYDGDGAAQPFETVGTPPAGALSASTDDMARFMLAQLDDASPLLDRPTMEQMHAPALDETTLGDLAAGHRMTLGFFDRSRNGHRMVEHGGDTDVFHSDLELYPDDGTGVFMTFNGSGRDDLSTVELREQVLEGFADRYYPGPQRATAGVDTDTAREHAEVISGTYESSRTVRSNFLAAAYALGQTSVTALDDGRLLVSPGPNSAEPATFEEVEPWVWREVGGHDEIAARVVDGRVEAIGVDNAFALLPVPEERTSAVLQPVVGGSVLVLALGTLGWLATALVRGLRRRRTSSAPAPGRALRVLTRLGMAAAALAAAGWAVLVTQVMGLGAPSTTSIRVVQALQLLGVLAIAPAALRLVSELRRRAGWRRVITSAVVLAALVGVAWAAIGLRLVSPDISY